MPFLRAGFNAHNRDTGIRGWTRPRAFDLAPEYQYNLPRCDIQTRREWGWIREAA